ncbi:glycosyl Hydrolase Family 88 [Cordyceps fumosorosea ARSEF 2679]|uniref:Glycosyl Hydrolase Family 88 n=1 Tax=Cordyceps fumosorosea (strain ARSEF 2679) TaxID=1081104 RepID=A0A167XC75_CORFA|nr:glycosyl Hydrolase Family 88 [Cordyceps fumosorosea ARSEF 2679]OAA64791.1 glycosyl Hydrolase Family 88 [Cordyceps fumosorosea ARSEF 2679]
MRLPPPLVALSGVAAATIPSSLHMLDSIMSRGQGTVSSSGAVTSTLESGLLAAALAAAITQYPSSPSFPRYADYLGQVISVASPALGDAAHDAAAVPLDRFSIATGIDAARAAAAAPIPAVAAVDAAYLAVNASLALQPRNPDGGFWYYVYPDWSYLDGMYSLLPFMAAARPAVDYADMALQVRLLARRCRHADSGLYVHGYDWSRTAVWADPVTGASPLVWGRSLGWFLAGLVQAWERLDCHDRRGEGDAPCAEMREAVVDAAPRLVALADAETGAWWQLPTLGGRPGNFLESSSTALFVFALLKARRLGLLEAVSGCCGEGCGGADRIRRAALRAYDYARANFVTDAGNGTVGFNGTVAVCSLNSTATFEYYTSRPLVPNGLLGSAAFVLASLEVEKLAA